MNETCFFSMYARTYIHGRWRLLFFPQTFVHSPGSVERWAAERVHVPRRRWLGRRRREGTLDCMDATLRVEGEAVGSHTD